MDSKRENGSRVWMRGIKKLWRSYGKPKRLKRTWKNWNRWGLCCRTLKQPGVACIQKQSKKKFISTDNLHHHPLKWVIKEKAQSREDSATLWVSQWQEPILLEIYVCLPTMWTSIHLPVPRPKDRKDHAKIHSVNSLRWLFLLIRFATKRNLLQ